MLHDQVFEVQILTFGRLEARENFFGPDPHYSALESRAPKEKTHIIASCTNSAI